ncbi:unnamed protein product [Allacma fusca]|uniref:Uncharacterized protein n=1 Tax=Allacma fusca TaxID=39272 RepID=A0A8J2KZ54_9HEXA|nr:unnamed protein product [Allacma fusca]
MTIQYFEAWQLEMPVILSSLAEPTITVRKISIQLTMASKELSRIPSFLNTTMVWIGIVLGLCNVVLTSASAIEGINDSRADDEVSDDAKKILGIGLTVFIVVVAVVAIVIIATIVACVCCCVRAGRRSKRAPPTPVPVVEAPKLQQSQYGTPPPYFNEGPGNGYRNDQALPRANGYPQKQQQVHPPAQVQQQPHFQQQPQHHQYQNQQLQLQPNQQHPGVSSLPPQDYDSGVDYVAQQQPGDPNLIVNRFKPTVPPKPNRDPAWNAVNDELKDWQKQHNFGYTNYGYAEGNKITSPTEHGQNTNFLY